MYVESVCGVNVLWRIDLTLQAYAHVQKHPHTMGSHWQSKFLKGLVLFKHLKRIRNVAKSSE